MKMTLTIDRLGHHGDGIANGPDGDIYVPYTLPGEVIEGECDGNRIAAPKVVTSSDMRVKAPCPHFKSCGGCAMQHAAPAFLAGWKQEIVQTALAAHGISAPFRKIAVSPPASRRRATLTGRRTKKGAMVGFHARASEALIAIPSCTLLHPDIVAGIPVLERLTQLGASRKGEVSLAVTRSDAGLDVAVEGGKDTDGALLAELGQICGQTGLARLSWNGEVIAMRSAPVQTFGRTEVIPPPGAFLQATAEGQLALQAAVSDAIGGARRIADLFAGCGTFTLPLAETAEVAAFESEPAQLAALDQGWRVGHELRTVTTETRDLFRRPLMPQELARFDAVVIDPPRAGAKDQTEILAESVVSRIAFVSCNPVTFARDATTLIAGGYLLDWIQVVDQFPWSPHLELVALFSR